MYIYDMFNNKIQIQDEEELKRNDEKEIDEIAKKEIEFDMKDQKIILSKKKEKRNLTQLLAKRTSTQRKRKA